VLLLNTVATATPRHATATPRQSRDSSYFQRFHFDCSDRHFHTTAAMSAPDSPARGREYVPPFW